MQPLYPYIENQLIVDQPGLALSAIQTYAATREATSESVGLPTVEGLDTLVARYHALQLQHTHPDTQPKDFRKALNRLNVELASLSCKLPADANLPLDWKPELEPLIWEKPKSEAPVRTKGISDRIFQWHILLLLLLIKAGIFLYVTILQEAGGLSSAQFQATLSVLIPVVAAYLGTMFKHLFSRKDPNQVDDQPASYTSRSIQWLTYGVFVLYCICYLSLLTAKGKNDIEFKSLIFWINSIEVVFGVLIGYVVSTMFAEK